MPNEELQRRADIIEAAILLLVAAHVESVSDPLDQSMIATSGVTMALCKVGLMATGMDPERATDMLSNLPWRTSVLACLAEMAAAEASKEEP